MSAYYSQISNRLLEESVLSPIDVRRILKGKISPRDLWQPYAFSIGSTSCELCGTPIVNVYWIKNTRSDKLLRIGSRCIHNYLHADLVKAFTRLGERELLKRRYKEEYGWLLELDLSRDGHAIEIVRLVNEYAYIGDFNTAGNVIRKLHNGQRLTRKDRATIALLRRFFENNIDRNAILALHLLEVVINNQGWRNGIWDARWYARRSGSDKQLLDLYAPNLNKKRKGKKGKNNG